MSNLLFAVAGLTLAFAQEAEECANDAQTELLQVALGLHKDAVSDPSMQNDDCWNHTFAPKDAYAFHLHIPKVAGCSTVHDVGQIVGRGNLWSDEVCFSWSKHAQYNKTTVMFRRPRDHVFSMYEHCKTGGGPGYYAMLHALNAAPGEPNFAMPDTFGEWVQSWAIDPHFGTYGVMVDKFHCYYPRNMQSNRMTCDKPSERLPSVDVSTVISNMKLASAVGLVEAYHESICLFSAVLTGSLPSHCDCENATAWASFEGTDEDHGVEYNSTVDAQPEEVLTAVDYLTQADRELYQAAADRFIEDVKALKSSFGVQVLCSAQEQKIRSIADEMSKI